MTRLAVIGAGVMGETLIAGLLRAGWEAGQITASDRHAPRLAEMENRHHIHTADTAQACADADTVVIVVKPQDSGEVLPVVGAAIRPGTLVVSLCAGLSTGQIEAAMPEGTAVVRVMPNTPAQVDEGMAAISAGSSATAENLQHVTDLMSAVGKVVTVPEKYQDAVTAISGSGPAYLFFVVEAMIDAGVMLGLPRDISTTLVVQTMYGSAKLLADSGEHPTVLRERVTSPGGTTAAALRELEDHRVKAAFMTAMEAARDRSRALASS
ncbi:MAG: pyrroline-5-carboxylate reductase [Actinobacteria bacterium]|nr:pyrroline-5-carboxylate reductase [Actinomycetota bacterium]MCA0434956.1 pyrroline-5-carboxylate reductase [Actinomycetota bacterium]